jgi:O-antigen/teichoic acid export membrane protein
MSPVIKNILFFKRIPKTLSDTILYSLSAAFLGTINFILLPLLSRSLGESGYGDFSIITSFTAIAASISFLGMTSAVQRFYYKPDTSSDRESIFYAGFAITLAGALLQIVGAFLLSSFISGVFFSGKSYLAVPLFFGLAYSSSQIITSYVSIRYRINRDPVGALSFSLNQLLLNILALFVVSFFGALRSINLVFIALLLSSLIHLLFHRTLWWGRCTLSFFSNHILKDLLKFGIGSVFASGAAQLFLSSDILIASHFFDNSAVGQLASITKVSALYSMLFVSAVSQVFPYIVYSKEGSQDLLAKANTALTAFLGLSLSAITLVSLLASKLLPYLTSFDFSNSLLIVIYVSLFVAVFNGVVNFSSMGLLLALRVDLLIYAYVVAACFKFLLFTMFSPSFGLPVFLVFVAVASLFLNVLLFLMSASYLSFSMFLSKSIYFLPQTSFAVLGFCLFGSKLPFPITNCSYVLIALSFLWPSLVPALRRPMRSLFSFGR